MNRYIHTIYCEDIRREEGNKQSLMGIYSNELWVPELPIVLPKLCVVVTLATPVDNPFKKLTIKITKNDESLIEAPLVGDQLHQPQAEIIDNGDKNNADRNMALNLTFVLAPFSIEKECVLRVIASTEDGELRGGALRIKTGQPPQAA